MKDLKIVFMGTPDFAVTSLKALVDNKYNVVGVVTVPDKPAGRGLNVIESPIKQFAKKNGLRIFQPDNLKNDRFINELIDLKPDVQVVVAFRMLPKVVWQIPKYGTFNLHASLLPQYRGAAPINRAIINGETETGVTTFFIDEKIDTGNIIYKEATTIDEKDTAGELHDKLMDTGARLVLKTLDAIKDGNYPSISQKELLAKNENLKPAPKISKEDCRINWKKSIHEIYNFIRGMSPYPAAFTEILQQEKKIQLKIFKTEKELASHDEKTGTIISDQKVNFKIAVEGGFLNIKELQLAGKKRMAIEDFLRGFKFDHPRIADI